jgi:hypothetical protein
VTAYHHAGLQQGEKVIRQRGSAERRPRGAVDFKGGRG